MLTMRDASLSGSVEVLVTSCEKKVLLRLEGGFAAYLLSALGFFFLFTLSTPSSMTTTTANC